MREKRRTPPRNIGCKVTNKRISDVSRGVLSDIGYRLNKEGKNQCILELWPEIIGKNLDKMTVAESFKDGILTVRVKNSTLYSLLVHHDKMKVMNSFRQKFPKILIKDIIFRMG